MENADLIFWIAQGFGLIAFGVGIWSLQIKSKINLLRCSGIAQAISIIQYLLLGGFTGAATKALAAIRSFLAAEK